MHRILIVEDDAIVALHLEQTLKNLGYRVVGHETSGEAAVKAARKHKPDAALMDIRLHGEMTGVEAAERILERPGTPVVFVTAFENMHNQNPQSRAASCPALIKPVADHLLADTLSGLLDKSGPGRG